MEKQDIYDSNRTKTKKIMLRGQKPLPGEYHLITHVCIFNNQNEMLIQQRQHSLSTYPGKWDVSVGGHVLSGESTLDAAIRESQEELRLRLSPEQLKFLLTRNLPYSFDDFYGLKLPVEIHGLNLQPEEVCAVRWASLEQILTMIHSENFLPYPEDFIKILFEHLLALDFPKHSSDRFQILPDFPDHSDSVNLDNNSSMKIPLVHKHQ